jgi:serine/threonine protein kinase
LHVNPGSRLGAYDVLAKLGAGGMGEVYRARDTRLNRDVAIKVLPEAFASDPERLARFTREAQTLASFELGGRNQEVVQQQRRSRYNRTGVAGRLPSAGRTEST